MKALALALVVVLVSATAFAGGPLEVGGTTQGIDGQPLTWDNSKPIQYRVDTGAFGSMSNSAALALVASEFQQWASVPGVSLSTQNIGAIQGGVNGHITSVSDFNTLMSSCQSGSQSPIVLDDGTLVKALTGDSSVLGFSGPCSFSPTGHIQSAFSLVTNQSFLPAGLVNAEVLHELGHFLGLDHTDIRVPFSGTTQTDADNTPTMFYLLITPNMQNLKPDDKAWMAKLYPSPSYGANYGVITGQVLFYAGNYGAQDVLVVARNVNDIHGTVVSNISGYRFTSNPGQKISTNYMPCVPANQCTNGTWGDNPGDGGFGSHDATLAGRYEIPVPPGQYTIEVRQLGNDGKIGQFNPALPMPGPEEYWDTDESDHDWDSSPGNVLTAANPGVVTVNSGQTVDNINIILNSPYPDFDIFTLPTASGAAPSAGGAQ